MIRAAAAAVVAIALAAWVPAAGAHSSIAATSPPSGAILREAPDRIVVDYLDALIGARAAMVVAGGADVSGEPRLDPADARRLVIPLTATPAGAYRASWVVVAADGHPLAGELSFRVREPARQAPARTVAAHVNAASGVIVARMRVLVGAL